MADFSVFLPIAKIDKDKRTVSGYASTPAKDSDGEIVTLDAIKAALPGYMKWGNIREMHKLSAVGKAEEANIDTKGLFLTAKIVDDVAWKKCLEGVYKGFSIGGRKLDKSGNKITEIDMTEISVVDRPANPECSFSLAKMAKAVDDKHPGYLLKVGPERTPEQKALAKMAKVVGTLAKAGPPAAHDGFSLPAKPTAKAEANPSPNDDVADGNDKAVGSGGSTADVNMAPPACEKHGKVGCKKCAIVKRMAEACEKHGKIACVKCAFGKKEKTADKEPYGDVEYADPGHQADGKKRYPIDTEDHIRAAWSYINKPKNAAKYKPEHASSVKAKIVSAWKDKIHKDGPPGAEPAKKAAQTEALSPATNLPCLTLGKSAASAVDAELAFLSLGKVKNGPDRLAKGMQAAGTLSFAFDRLRDVQRSLLLEGKREGGDKKDHGLADTLGGIAKQIAAVIAQKAEHEGAEAVDLSDADDAYVNNMLSAGEATTMSQFNYAAAGDPLTKAIMDTLAKAAMPSPMMRMKKAEEEMAEARKTMKEAKKMIKAAHDMHKAAYLAKTTGGDVAKAAASAEFDHVGAMEKLQKAYNDVDKARTFSKAAMGEMSKARAGQSGQEVTDGNASYKVPPGIKELSVEDMKNAAANGGDLAKYAKNGQISAEVAQLLLEKATTQGELEALRRLPAGVVGRQGRPYSFDTQRMFGGAGSGQQDTTQLAKALFDGVDVNALGSGDEQAHGMAAAKAAGNFLLSGQFGKSVFDPSFHGAAGSK